MATVQGFKIPLAKYDKVWICTIAKYAQMWIAKFNNYYFTVLATLNTPTSVFQQAPVISSSDNILLVTL
jgi:hypothetical protein